MTQVVPSPDETKLPLVKEYRAAMDKYKPSIPDGVADGNRAGRPPTLSAHSEGYLDMKLLGAVLAKAGKDLTRASFKTAVELVHRLRRGGLPGDKVSFAPVIWLQTRFATTKRCRPYG